MEVAHNEVFPLASSSHRIALLLAVREGQHTIPQIDAELLQDCKLRKRAKPIVAYGVRYSSITNAAKALLLQRKERWNKDDYYSALNNQKQRLTRLCNEGPVTGVYWSV